MTSRLDGILRRAIVKAAQYSNQLGGRYGYGDPSTSAFPTPVATAEAPMTFSQAKSNAMNRAPRAMQGFFGQDWKNGGLYNPEAAARAMGSNPNNNLSHAQLVNAYGAENQNRMYRAAHGVLNSWDDRGWVLPGKTEDQLDQYDRAALGIGAPGGPQVHDLAGNFSKQFKDTYDYYNNAIDGGASYGRFLHGMFNSTNHQANKDALKYQIATGLMREREGQADMAGMLRANAKKRQQTQAQQENQAAALKGEYNVAEGSNAYDPRLAARSALQNQAYAYALNNYQRNLSKALRSGQTTGEYTQEGYEALKRKFEDAENAYRAQYSTPFGQKTSSAYARGYLTKCASLGIDGRSLLEKRAAMLRWR